MNTRIVTQALHAAEPPRLQDAQDAGRVVLGDGLGRQLPRRRTPPLRYW